MIIRKASKNNLEAISSFAEKMLALHREIDPYYKSPEQYKNLREDLAAELESPASSILIAEDGGVVLGYIRIAVEEAPAYAMPKKIGVLYDLFVDEARRREGVGEKLFNEALEWLRAKNIRHIELSVDARNSGAIAVWKKFGFFEYKIRMRKDL